MLILGEARLFVLRTVMVKKQLIAVLGIRKGLDVINEGVVFPLREIIPSSCRFNGIGLRTRVDMRRNLFVQAVRN